MKIAVGDKVRVHFHSPGPMKSFSEGVIRRVDVTSAEGRIFVLEVTHEVILDREHRIRPGFQDYVCYECHNDFPGRVEVLSTPKQGGMDNDVADPVAGLRRVEAPDVIAQEPDAEHGQHVVYLERQEIPRPRGFIAALFGRQK